MDPKIRKIKITKKFLLPFSKGVISPPNAPKNKRLSNEHIVTINRKPYDLNQVLNNHANYNKTPLLADNYVYNERKKSVYW